VADFTPFPVPVKPSGKPLVQHAGFDYLCTGCGEHVPDGLCIYEEVEDGMVVGLRMTGGQGGSAVHQCGRVSN
jgi:hypothetical protein